ncbi:hypothetical protein PPL_09751 [Heterostelium album PN500]|uniref:IPT/TIG domain-containing protein n=1 Tax=Heterostelium pallidum (strain ATCC 26659 / Pp 5 / PN500) TaxID=670386 RepID=D3BNP8_HETP5|nr:hypothetical protein PPL_09751 [Heterostelium album PN500]EFA76999.1 hypothetical protein PPL_09751 [Heterostelium album PN500]|eukprot:XP_020429130.1 hypothetical protein PPL_09751 [Heterostelium album PN500]
MINKYSKLLILSLITLSLTFINGQSTDLPLDQVEYDSMVWYVNQYQLGAPFNSSDFCNCKPYIECIITNGRKHINSIYIPDAINLNIKPNPTLLPPKFNLPFLTNYNVEYATTIVDPSVNILELLNDSPKLYFIAIQNDTSITSIPVFKYDMLVNLILQKVGTIQDFSNLKNLTKLVKLQIDSPTSFDRNTTFKYIIDPTLTLLPGEYTFDQNFPIAQLLYLNTERPGNYTFIFNSTTIQKLRVGGTGRMNITFLNTSVIDTLGNKIPAHYTLLIDNAAIDTISYAQINSGFIFTITGAFNLTKPTVTVSINSFPCFLNETSNTKIVCQSGVLIPGNNDVSVNINGQNDLKQIVVQPTYPFITSVTEVGNNHGIIFDNDDSPFTFSFRGNFGPNPVNSTKISISNQPCKVVSVTTEELVCSISIKPGKSLPIVQLTVGKFNYYSNNLMFFYIKQQITSCNGNGKVENGECVCEDGWSGFRCDSQYFTGATDIKHGISSSSPNNANYFNFYVGNQVYQLEVTAIKEMNVMGAEARSFKPQIIATSGGNSFFNLYDEKNHNFGLLTISNIAGAQTAPAFHYELIVNNYTYQSINNHLRLLYSLSVNTVPLPTDECGDFVYTDYRFANDDLEYFRVSQDKTALLINVTAGLESNGRSTYYIKSYTGVNRQTSQVYFDFPYCDYCKQPLEIELLRASDSFHTSCSIDPPTHWELFIYVPLAGILLVGIIVAVILLCKRKLFTNNERFFDFE